MAEDERPSTRADGITLALTRTASDGGARGYFSTASRGITGVLVYAEGVFLQVLEGETEAITLLMARISRDLRHEAVAVL